jgi:hypothetical protein
MLEDALTEELRKVFFGDSGGDTQIRGHSTGKEPAPALYSLRNGLYSQICRKILNFTDKKIFEIYDSGFTIDEFQLCSLHPPSPSERQRN